MKRALWVALLLLAPAALAANSHSVTARFGVCDGEYCLNWVDGDIDSVAPGDSVSLTIGNDHSMAVDVTVSATTGSMMVYDDVRAINENGTEESYERTSWRSDHADVTLAEATVAPGQAGILTFTVPDNATGFRLLFVQGDHEVFSMDFGYYTIMTGMPSGEGIQEDGGDPATGDRDITSESGPPQSTPDARDHGTLALMVATVAGVLAMAAIIAVFLRR